MKTIKWLFLLAVFGTLTAAGWLLQQGASGDQISWRTYKVTRGDISEVVSATGPLNPRELVTVGTQVTGKVNSIYIKVNENVTKGQLLAEIDPTLLQAELKQAKSSMDNARVAYEQSARDLERTRQLLAKDYVPKVDLERAQASYLSAENNYNSAKTAVERSAANLDYTKIVSPIDGTVILQDVQPGQTVVASTTPPRLFIIAGDMGQMKIDVNFNQSDIAQIKAGMGVTFTVDAFQDDQFAGTVETVNLNPNSENGVVTYTVVVSVENPEKKLFPGMIAYVNVILNRKKDVLFVPASALRFVPPDMIYSKGPISSLLGIEEDKSDHFLDGTKHKTVFVLRDGKLQSIKVDTGITDEVNIEISKGVVEGDEVVTGIVPMRKL